MGRTGYYNKNQGEMLLITKAKELSKYVFQTSQNAPKKFRFSLVGKMQSATLEIISNIYKANEMFIDLKILQDLDKSINALKEKKTFKSQDEKYYTENKILTLKLTRATKFEERISKRLDYSYNALTNLKELDHLIILAREMQCITPKQHEVMAEEIWNVRNLLAAWIKNDRKRFNY